MSERDYHDCEFKARLVEAEALLRETLPVLNDAGKPLLYSERREAVRLWLRIHDFLPPAEAEDGDDFDTVSALRAPCGCAVRTDRAGRQSRSWCMAHSPEPPKGPYYRWPSGTFEDLGPPWQVYLYRPMPRTPAGDVVATFATKEEADAAADQLNRTNPSLEEVRRLYPEPV